MSIIYTQTKSTKRKPNNSKKYLKAKKEYQKFLTSNGIVVSPKRKRNLGTFPDLTTTERGAKLSNTIPGSCFKRSVYDYRWRKGSAEKQEQIIEAEKKRTRSAPSYNKGPVMYITDGDNPIFLGRKV